VIEVYGLSRDDRTFLARGAVDQCLEISSVNIGGRTLPQSTYAFVVYYLNDSSQFSIVFTTLDDHDAAHFYKFPTCRFDIDPGHSDESPTTQMSVLRAL
jgi:hypothetical protein